MNTLAKFMWIVASDPAFKKEFEAYAVKAVAAYKWPDKVKRKFDDQMSGTKYIKTAMDGDVCAAIWDECD